MARDLNRAHALSTKDATIQVQCQVPTRPKEHC